MSPGTKRSCLKYNPEMLKFAMYAADNDSGWTNLHLLLESRHEQKKQIISFYLLFIDQLFSQYDRYKYDNISHYTQTKMNGLFLSMEHIKAGV